MTLWVVFVDSNPQNVKGFFAVKTQAEAWRDANYPAGQVDEARVGGYERVASTVVLLP